MALPTASAMIQRLVFNRLRGVRDARRLRQVPVVTGASSHLGPISGSWLAGAMNSEKLAAEWTQVEREVHALGITSDADGVNAGDRRAIYHLVRELSPERVLEVGTHIGASTVHIAAAMRANHSGASRLTSVDLVDVNDAATRPWEKYGARLSPAALMDSMGMSARVSFVTQSSLEFLSKTSGTYDFIFLDGDHTAATVYQELPAALERLAPGGAILLHDYFPRARPLWPNGVVIPGPWLAAERLRSEGARIRVLPLGELPWLTKLGTRVTSLAVVAQAT